MFFSFFLFFPMEIISFQFTNQALSLSMHRFADFKFGHKHDLCIFICATKKIFINVSQIDHMLHKRGLHYTCIIHMKVFSIYQTQGIKLNLYCIATNFGNDPFKLYLLYEDIRL